MLFAMVLKEPGAAKGRFFSKKCLDFSLWPTVVIYIIAHFSIFGATTNNDTSTTLLLITDECLVVRAKDCFIFDYQWYMINKCIEINDKLHYQK